MQIQLLFTIPVWPRCRLLLLLPGCSARVPACLAMWQLAAAARLGKLKVFPGDIFWCERRESLVTYILTVIDATSVLKYYMSPHFINYQLKF